MEILIKSSAILGLFYIFYRLFLEKETFFQANRIFLNAGLLCSLILPWVIIPKYITKTTPYLTDSGGMSLQAFGTVEQAAMNWGLEQLVLTLYLLGIFVFGTRLILNFISLGKLMKQGAIDYDGKHKLIHVNDQVSPFSFFNRIVFNPQAFQSSELNQIIEHEKVHARQLHSLDLLLVQLFCTINWFNPFSWMYKKAVEQNLEFIADSEARKVSGSTLQYQRLLLNSAVPEHKLVLANNFFNSIIKKRIIMLQKQRSNKGSQIKLMLILPILALFLMSFNTREIIIYEAADTGAEAELMTVNPGETADIVEVIINKEMTDGELDELVEKFASMDITLKFSGVKRNDSGEIITIRVSVKTAKSSANFNSNSDEGINPIRIEVDDHSVSIGDGGVHKGHEVYRYRTGEDGNVWIKKAWKGDNAFFYSDEGEDVEIQADKVIIRSGGDVKTIKKAGKGSAIFIKDGEKEGEVEIIEIEEGEHEGHEVIIRKKMDSKMVEEWTEKDKGKLWLGDEDDVRVIIKNEGKEKIRIAGDSDDALILLDGKKVGKSAIEALDADKIESIEVIKGGKAIDKYGKKAKNGVIVIKTKE